MMATLIKASLGHRWLVLILVLGLMGLGVWTFNHQQIDAYPDISGQMVQIITPFPGRAPEEVERQVTIPIEQAMGNVPRVETIRSRTIFGLSVVQLSFEEGVDGYWARQRVQEKLPSIELPDSAKPDLGPYATAYGEIFRYTLQTTEGHSLMELRTLNDWVVIPRLLRVDGVADVSNFGGEAKQYSITLEPAQLTRYGLTLSDVLDAIKSNNADAGGSTMTRGSMSFVIRGRGALDNIATIEKIFIKSLGGTPIYLRDLATVGFAAKIPSGIYSKDFQDESVEGIVLMRRGENPSEVLKRVQGEVDKLNAMELPTGVKVVAFYDRSYLVSSTLGTVIHSVLLGITLVVLILLLFMGRPAIAALVALTIPFSLLFALVLMYFVNIPIGLLSVGAIDFGIIVDGAVIMADSIAHRLGAQTGKRNTSKTILGAALEVERPVFFSILMIVATYLPLLTLTRIEGLLFRPMALTIIFALIGALIFALFVVPVLATFFFRSGYREWENPLLRMFRPIYARILHVFLRNRYVVAITAVVFVGGIIGIIAPRLGIEFLPNMDEGVIWVRANFPEGTSLEQTSKFGTKLRSIALEFPDIKFISVQAGRNDSGTDPFPPSRLEVMIGPKPREQWKQFKTKNELVAELGNRFRNEFPTTRFNFTQPIIDSVTEDANGTSANVAVEFTGKDSEVLLELARKTQKMLNKVRGATDVSIEQEGPQPQLVIVADRSKCARYNIRIDDVTKLINNALGGEPVGTLYEAERRFNIVVKFDREFMNSPVAIARLPVFNADGVPIPLDQVADLKLVDGQTLIAREGSRRRLTVRCDITGRDQGGFVKDAQTRFEEEIQPHVPEGCNVEWLGMFQNLERARDHFLILIPVTLLLIFGLLMLTFHSYKAALLLLLLVPFAFIGGALALYFRGMNLNVSTGVGFAALFGVSLMDGVLMVKAITTLRQQGASLDDAIIEGAESRIRPILMTALVAMLGLLPASLATGLGSDVQRPLATVIVWGLFSAMILTLFLLPAFYRIVAPDLPTSAGIARTEVGEFMEPLPDVSVPEIIGVLDYLRGHEGEADVFRIAGDMQTEFASVVSTIKAAEMLNFVETPGQAAVLTVAGQQFLDAAPDERQQLWRDQILTLGVFREIVDVLQRQSDKAVEKDFILETIVLRLPYENYENVFNTVIRWARFGKLFTYDATSQRVEMSKKP